MGEAVGDPHILGRDPLCGDWGAGSSRHPYYVLRHMEHGSQHGSLLILFFFYITIYFWLCWVFIAVQAFLLLRKAGAALEL